MICPWKDLFAKAPPNFFKNTPVRIWGQKLLLQNPSPKSPRIVCAQKATSTKRIQPKTVGHGYKYTRALSWEELDKGYHCTLQQQQNLCPRVSDSLPGWDFCTKILLSTSIRVGYCFLKKFSSGYHNLFDYVWDPTSNLELTGIAEMQNWHCTGQGQVSVEGLFLEIFIISDTTVWIRKKCHRRQPTVFQGFYKAPKRNFISKVIWEASERLAHSHKIHTSSLQFSGKIPK